MLSETAAVVKTQPLFLSTRIGTTTTAVSSIKDFCYGFLTMFYYYFNLCQLTSLACTFSFPIRLLGVLKGIFSLVFGVLCIICIQTPKSEADLVSQFVTLRTRTHVTVWLVDWVLVIARSSFSTVKTRQDKTRQDKTTLFYQGSPVSCKAGILRGPGFNKTYIYTYTIKLQG